MACDLCRNDARILVMRAIGTLHAYCSWDCWAVWDIAFGWN